MTESELADRLAAEAQLADDLAAVLRMVIEGTRLTVAQATGALKMLDTYDAARCGPNGEANAVETVTEEARRG